jgi:uncharacterized protein
VKTDPAESPLQRSRYLAVHTPRSGARLAYHTLFGNLTWMDAELSGLLETEPGPLPWSRLEALAGPEIAHRLFASYFYVRSPEEEREEIAKWLQERRELAPTGHFVQGLQITSSNACNFACTYCFADASDKRSAVRQQIARGPANISYELAEQAIRQVRDLAGRNGQDRIAVKFLGREPLVSWPVIQRLLRTFDDGTVVWALTTNGSLLTREVADDLKAHQVMTMVSLDGPAPVNDTLRVLKARPGSAFEATRKALTNLSAVRHPFGVSSVLSSATRFSQMKSFVDGLLDFGVRELELTLAMQVDGLEAQSAHGSGEELTQALCDLYRHAQGKGLLVHGDWIDPFHRLLTTYKHREDREVTRPLGAACTATSHQLSLEPTGDLFPCRAMSTHYGHIDALEEALRSPSYEQVVMRTFYNVPACRSCRLEGFCQGTCLGSSEEASGDIYNPQEEYCAVYRRATDLLLQSLEPPQSFGAGL